MSVSRRLHQLRLEHGLTFEEVGKIAGTTKQNASQIEKGITKAPGGLFLYRWAKHYGVDLEWLITGKGSRIPSQSVQPDFEIVLDALRILGASNTEVSADSLRLAYEMALSKRLPAASVHELEPRPPLDISEERDGANERRSAGTGSDSRRKGRAGQKGQAKTALDNTPNTKAS